MNISRSFLLCAAACLGVFASCSEPPAAVPLGEVSSSVRKDSALADQVFREVNSYRASKGMAALSRHPGLDRLAQRHCDDLAKFSGGLGKGVNHNGFEGRVLAARQAYRITAMAENVISSTDRSAKGLVARWAASKGHDRNLRNDWACTGVATAVTDDGWLITTQIFGSSPDTSHPGMADRLNRH